jgi:hypothetical protein
MLKGINQADPKLISPIQHYGCYFLTLAQASPIVFQGEEGCQRLNGIWVKATELGIISGDINHDGDIDDDGEAEIQNVTRLAQEFFKLKVKYDGIHHGADEPIPANVKIVIGQYWYKGGHFVLLNKSKKVTFDSYGKSNTVKNGYLKTMRWFYAD